MAKDFESIGQEIDGLSEEIYEWSVDKGFWEHSHIEIDVGVYVDNPSIIPEKLALIHSEASEALSELRNDPVDEQKVEEELADIVIRVLDTAGHLGYKIGSAIANKHVKNINRPYKHGKRF